ARLNRVSDRLTALESSVGDRTGSQLMVAAGVLGAGYYVSPEKDHTRAELTLTPCTTLDGLAHKFQLRPTHVKVDVEGQELAVLRGSREILSRPDAPVLFLELHNQIVRSRQGDPGQTLDTLENLGYDTFTCSGIPLGRATILSGDLHRIVARKPACRREP